MRVRQVTNIDAVSELPAEQRWALRRVTDRYAFGATDYYLSLIDWKDPNDPLRRIVIPDLGELEPWGLLDPSNERAVTVAQGVQHKYPDTALLLVAQTCASCCRFCFRKRLFMPTGDQIALDTSEGIDYIARTPRITNVLLTGGDPLMLSTRRLVDLVGRLRAVPHVEIIRIGTKMPAYNPWRILDDDPLLDGLARFSTPRKRIYMMVHFDHPRELTAPAIKGLDLMLRAGLVLCNQCPLIRGVNDDPAVLAELFRALSFAGAPPYYLFQGRPAAGNRPYIVPLVEGYFINERAKRDLSGLAKRARFCMSHASGKIEIIGVDDSRIYLRYHRAKERADEGRLMTFARDDGAVWLDDLVIPVRASSRGARRGGVISTSPPAHG